MYLHEQTSTARLKLANFDSSPSLEHRIAEKCPHDLFHRDPSHVEQSQLVIGTAATASVILVAF